MKTIAVLTSGGDAPGMNAAVRSIAKVAAAKGMRVLGVLDGYDGLMAGRFRDLTPEQGGTLSSHPELDLVGNHGGTLLGSARSAGFRTPEGRAKALEHLAPMHGLIVIGGNGSLTGAHILAKETSIPIIGIPASIDNDIGCTSTAIGVDSALNIIVDACDKISDTARAHHRAFVVEVMGRQSGYLAMAGGIAAGADALLFREQGRSYDDIIEAVANCIRRAFERPDKRRVLIIKSEGVEIPCTKLVREVQTRLDAELPNVDVRATVLGHLVRGGNPSYQDRMIAGRFAVAALMLVAQGVTDEMVSWLPQQVEGGQAMADPAVFRFPLATVLRETDALLDGTSEVTRWRVKMLEELEGALAL
ncbi:MAG: 6-phosphofructokinase [Polyangiaceae bacterium]